MVDDHRRPALTSSSVERIFPAIRHGVPGGPVLYFFLSYAHGARDDNARVHRFFDDLSTEIRELVGEDGGRAVGFHDDGILRIGDDWPRELAEALCRAQTMVALCSPRYFRSDFCGREWAVFTERVRRWENTGKPRRARLIPISWVWGRFPQMIDHVHYRDASFGANYERDGLRELMREDGRDYIRFVRAVAQRIVQITDGPPMATTLLWSDLRTVTSAFAPGGGVPTPVGNPPAADDQTAADHLTAADDQTAADHRTAAENPPVGEDEAIPRPILSLETADVPRQSAAPAPAETVPRPEHHRQANDERTGR